MQEIRKTISANRMAEDNKQTYGKFLGDGYYHTESQLRTLKRRMDCSRWDAHG